MVDAHCILNLCNELSEDEIDLNLRRYSYNKVVFLFPPWEEIYRADGEQDQTFAESIRVFDSVKIWYCRCGFQIQEVPFDVLEKRVDSLSAPSLRQQLSSCSRGRSFRSLKVR